MDKKDRKRIFYKGMINVFEEERIYGIEEIFKR